MKIKPYIPVVKIEMRSMWNEKEYIDCPEIITKEMLDAALADWSRFINLWDETINKADIKRVFIVRPQNDIEEFIAQQSWDFKKQLQDIYNERKEKKVNTNWITHLQNIRKDRFWEKKVDSQKAIKPTKK